MTESDSESGSEWKGNAEFQCDGCGYYLKVVEEDSLCSACDEHRHDRERLQNHCKLHCDDEGECKYCNKVCDMCDYDYCHGCIILNKTVLCLMCKEYKKNQEKYKCNCEKMDLCHSCFKDHYFDKHHKYIIEKNNLKK